VIQIQSLFQFRPDWYREGVIAERVGEYYVVLRTILRTRPELRPCLRRCRHCRIFFLTHPRNARRCDLACPFGCRQAHRQRDSTRRSVEYYRSWEGKVKKALHNHNRRCRTRPAPVPGRAHTADRVPGTQLEGTRFDAGLVCYVQMVTSLIEGRRVSEAEIVRMLVRAVRQHSMARRRRREYLLSCWEGSLQSP